MKKLMNEPQDFVDETLQGILTAHSKELKVAEGILRVLVRADAPLAGRVGIITGGGSGHLPVFLGYVGQGLATGVAIGNVFSSPTTRQVLAAARAVNGGAGVLYLYGNYSGDVMNFDMAAEMAELEDIEVATVLVTDDVASAPRERAATRRGVAGLFFAYKLSGAKAESGASLAEVKATATKVVNNTRTMGVGLSPTILPTVGQPTFVLAEDEMEIGIGIHGEPGVRRGKLEKADEIATDITSKLIADFPLKEGDEVAVLVNGLGATPLEELYIVFRKVAELLNERDIQIYRPYIGEFATSLEMAGCSITLLRLDAELKGLLDAPASSPFFVQV